MYILKFTLRIGTIVGTEKSEICRAGQQADNQERDDVAVLSLKVVWRQNSSFPKGPQSLLSRPSTDGVKLTHIMEGRLLYWKFTDLNVNLTLKVPSQQHLDWCSNKLGTIV